MPSTDPSEERGAMLERSAEGARPVDRPEQLVEQVAMAVLHVDEVEAASAASTAAPT